MFNVLLSPLFDTLIDTFNYQDFMFYILLLPCVAIFVTAAHYLGLLLLRKLSQHVVSSIREDLFKHVQRLPMSYFDTKSDGQIMSVMTHDFDMFSLALEESISK